MKKEMTKDEEKKHNRKLFIGIGVIFLVFCAFINQNPLTMFMEFSSNVIKNLSYAAPLLILIHLWEKDVEDEKTEEKKKS